MDRCNQLEGGGSYYKPVITTIYLYDGRQVQGQIYTRPRESLKSQDLPSKRYLNLIIDGAKEAKLDPEYIKKLEAQPYYIPSQETKEKRQNVPAPESLPKISYRELRKQIKSGGETYVFVGLLGYII